ncbi:MAG: hypothetical protein ACK4L7_11905, partial [Flavobacteriales bacterium]
GIGNCVLPHRTAILAPMAGDQARIRHAQGPLGLLALVIALLVAPIGSFAIDGHPSDAEGSMLESSWNEDCSKDCCEPTSMEEAEALTRCRAGARFARVDYGYFPGHASIAVPPPEA